MPFSFTEIEKRKTRVTDLSRAALVVFYFGTFWILFLLLRMFIYPWFTVNDPPGIGPFQVLIDIPFYSWQENLFIAGFAGLAGAFHFELATRNIVPKVLKILKACSPDPALHRQVQFANILEELTVATGNHRFDGYVIPSLSVNALAIDDFDGRATICVTDGLLRRLNRAQLEAVCAHEAAHLLQGDSLDSTVLVSLFNLPTELLREMNLDWDNTALFVIRSSMRGIFTYAAFWSMIICSRTVGALFNLFLSRQREFRADAIAVRLSRDPLSLAQALYKTSFHWHGAGAAGEYLAPLYIVSPRPSLLEESSGLLADLFSTHPPLEKRLAVLLDMAHVSMEEFREAMSYEGEAS